MRNRWELVAGSVLAAGFSVLVLFVLYFGAHGLGVGTAEDPPEESIFQGESDAGAGVLGAVERSRDRPEIVLGVEREATLGFLSDGQVIVVAMSGFGANTSGRLAQCRHRGAGLDDCTNGFAVRFDEAGAARIQYAVEAPGSGAPCSAVALCVLTVSGGRHSASGFLGFGGPANVPVPVVPPPLPSPAPRPSVRYDGWRLGAGGAAALLLCVLAVVVVRRTDWREPTQASTPEMDGIALG
jgi:hypothetical protein